MVDESEYAEMAADLNDCRSTISSLEDELADLECQLDDMYRENRSLTDEIDDLSEIQKYEDLSDALLDFYRATKEGRSTYSAEIEVHTHLSSMDILV